MSVRAQTWAWEQRAGTDKLLLIALADHANDDGLCWPGQRRLAAKTERKERAIRDGLKRLEAVGLLEREPRYRDGHRITDLYRLPIAADFAGSKPADSDVHTGSSLPGGNRKEPSKEKNVDREAEDRIYSYWLDATGRNGRTRFTDGRRQKVRQRRRHYADEEILRAISNCSSSEFHVSGGYTDLTLICRSDEKLEAFRDMGGGDDAAWEAFLA